MIEEIYRPLFIRWATIWHGDHGDCCSINRMLYKYNNGLATFEEVYNEVTSEDDEWEESWVSFQNRH